MGDDALIWADVRFDHAVAQQAAAECERAARLLREVAGRRGGLSRSALVGADGPWRDQLAAGLAGLDRTSADLEAQLRGLARGLLAAASRAKTEQSRRETARTTNVGHLGTESVPK